LHISGQSTSSLTSDKYGLVEWRFMTQYMEHHHPNRAPYQWFNSSALRQAFRNAP
jgi:hypothetical protein